MPEPAARTGNVTEVAWEALPGQCGGTVFKLLAHPETTGSPQWNYRISTYQPHTYVEPHVRQAIYNTDLTHQVCIVVTSPERDE